MLNEEPPNSDIARSKSAIVLQLYSIILLVCGVYFSYLLILEIIISSTFFSYILWIFELANELLLIYWTTQGVAWAKIGSLTVYGKLFRVSLGLVIFQIVAVLAELISFGRSFRWECGVSLVLRFLFYSCIKKCCYCAEASSHTFDPLDIPNFSYERLTEKNERESLFQSFRTASREALHLKESPSDIDNPPKTPHGNVTRSFVFS